MARKPRRSAPIPEILDRALPLAKTLDRKWVVREPGDGGVVGTDLQRGTMTVPLDDSDASTFVRRHEMARLTWSPNDPITDPFEQAFEEARLNLLTKQVGLPTETYRAETAVVETIANALGNPAQAALTRIALTGTSDEPIANRTLAGINPQVGLWANEALTHLRRSKLTYQGVQDAAAYLRERLKQAKSRSTPQDGEAPGRAGKGSSDAPPMPTPKLVLPPMPEPPKAPAKKRPEAKPGKPAEPDLTTPVHVMEYVPEEGKQQNPLEAITRKKIVYDGRTAYIPWAPMTVKTPPLPLRLPRRVGKGKWRPADSGAHPRRMERWATDQAVFSTKGRQRSGTVLIDGSGSMSIPVEQILRILTQVPAATVAMYSGGGQQGWLWILARRGRRVASIPRRPGGNCVDGPALRWLARQKTPRLWVCDEGVTGVDDRQAPGMIEECQTICRTFGIRRVERVDDVIRLMAGAKQLRSRA